MSYNPKMNACVFVVVEILEFYFHIKLQSFVHPVNYIKIHPFSLLLGITNSWEFTAHIDYRIYRKILKIKNDSKKCPSFIHKSNLKNHATKSSK